MANWCQWAPQVLLGIQLSVDEGHPWLGKKIMGRKDLEPGKRIRVGGYKERLSKPATWQEGPPSSSEGSKERI